MTTPLDRFPAGTAGLPDAHAPEAVELADGDRFDLRIAPVAKRIGDATVRMLAYNGSIPGPTLRVRQGSNLVVAAANGCEFETTVHWHGLRLENRYDGTTETQRPIPPGGRFTYHLDFPDPGVYWYHPHIRRGMGAAGAAIDWRFRVGDRLKIRLVNEMESALPMPHPFHIHGAGRFLVLSRNGVVEPNLVWKDTVLVDTGQTVDILLEVTHPGIWMAHCHISEHHETGMMLRFRVEP